MLRSTSLYLLVLLCCLSMPSAWADEAPADDSDSYFQVGVSTYIVDLPHYNPFWLRGAFLYAPYEHAPSLTNDYAVAPRFEVTLGQRFADRWFGEFRGHYAALNSQEDDDDYLSDRTLELGWFGIDGSQASRGTINTIIIDLTHSFRQLGGEFLLGRTYDLGSMDISPFGGVWVQYRSQEYELDADMPASNDWIENTEEVGALYLGPVVGLRLDYGFGGWSIGLETSHGLALVHAWYDGTQVYNGEQLFQESSEEALAYKGELSAEFSRQMGEHWKLGLTGGVEYLSYSPEVVASNLSTNEFGNGRQPAHVNGEYSLSGKLGLDLSYSF